ncbi:ComF family protein [Chitinophaga sp. Cy-1792]|uniref:ComF family protein n=1 Tax=Chitinophaga sp. Cy-1792 TaxID=2608339 RepID=UPI00141E73E3|nr:phosphoribosyltransferase family protein [Chitinophaga sp. Cy-1792]
MELFYPHCCDICGADLNDKAEKLCISCAAGLPATQYHLLANNPVEKIFWGRAPVSHAMAGYYYTKSAGIQQLIHLFKYKNRQDIALYMGRKMGHMLLQSEWLYEIDALIPVPLFPGKERQRGYNQATLLCQGIAAITGKSIWTDVLRREKYTNTQTRKGRVSRWDNVSDVFNVSKSLKGNHLLLVDDVITTGATTEACCLALQKAGANVSVSCLAYAWT